MPTPLRDLFVVDLSEGIPGAYCSKMLADGGAEVVKLEHPDGDPLRRWAIGANVAPGEDGALFRFLAGSKRSVVVDLAVPGDRKLADQVVGGAGIVVWSPGALGDHLSCDALVRLAPGAVVVAITPFGLSGPWTGRPATDMTLQAWAGGVAGRGSPSRPPAHCGGRPGQWLAGTTAAVAALTAHLRALDTGAGEVVDVSILETLTLMLSMYPVTRKTMMRSPERGADVSLVPARAVTIPSVERATDGWVGFMVATATMWESFSVMVEHPEWPEDRSTYTYAGRASRRDELEPAIASWVGQRTVAEVLEMASLLRVPAAPVGTGATVATFDHFAERKFFVTNPRGGFIQPDVPYTLGGSVERQPAGPAPRLGEHTNAERAMPPRATPASCPATPSAASKPPFEGMRVADFTAFWAGPIVGHYLAMLGADVIHIESPKYPDGIRAHTIKSVDDDQWWEYSPLFAGPNTNKRDVTIDMNDERGRELALRLIAECDVVMENYSPRVMDHWGFDYETVRRARPDVIFLRMPAFGLSGPWRDRTGYAQNMEQASGMAWVTGFPDGPPHVPNGVCDPLAGTHATAALLLAVEHHKRTGEGMQVEVAMVGAALNVAAEQVIEHSAYGHLMERHGNRGIGAPQNLYRAADAAPGGLRDTWVAIEVENDTQWEALRGALGNPAWAEDPALASAGGRRAAHDEVDKHLGAWCEQRSADEIVTALWPAGVPVGTAISPSDADRVPQHVARGFFESVTHPLTGENLHPGYPARFSAGPTRYHRAPAPLLGQHNREVFEGLLGLTDHEFAALEAAGIIGDRLLGEHRTR